MSSRPLATLTNDEGFTLATARVVGGAARPPCGCTGTLRAFAFTFGNYPFLPSASFGLTVVTDSVGLVFCPRITTTINNDAELLAYLNDICIPYLIGLGLPVVGVFNINGNAMTTPRVDSSCLMVFQAIGP